ncbi:hypothetical protein KIPB_013999 [Kipferlia bialata]|uniref:Uncharacterized protein n=1 Tax=Kipferlia bialata TaxID=797122 RepID=A0A9K3D875_9EUKA|nr:hypothetical protein KIPB_013999 [Kipferlia bialata]|eukprot:g13999.t1
MAVYQFVIRYGKEMLNRGYKMRGTASTTSPVTQANLLHAHHMMSTLLHPREALNYYTVGEYSRTIEPTTASDPVPPRIPFINTHNQQGRVYNLQ